MRSNICCCQKLFIILFLFMVCGLFLVSDFGRELTTRVLVQRQSDSIVSLPTQNQDGRRAKNAGHGSNRLTDREQPFKDDRPNDRIRSYRKQRKSEKSGLKKVADGSMDHHYVSHAKTETVDRSYSKGFRPPEKQKNTNNSRAEASNEVDWDKFISDSIKAKKQTELKNKHVIIPNTYKSDSQQELPAQTRVRSENKVETFNKTNAPIQDDSVSSTNISGVHKRRTSADGWNIIYSSDELHTEVQKIHNALYVSQRQDVCIQRNPGCIIVGVAKCGTRELSDFMSMHPQMVVKSGHYKISSTLFKTLEGRQQIKTKMPCTYSDQLGMIKADSFFTDVKIPKLIRNLNQNMKIIVLVREPVSRIKSQLTFRLIKNEESGNITVDPKFDKQFSEIQYVTKNGKLLHTGAVKLSTYSEGMKRYLKIFRREQIHVIETHEFINDPVGVLQGVEKFLGLKPIISKSFFAFNPYKNFFCIKRFRAQKKGMVCYAGDRGRKVDSNIDEYQMSKLKEYFKPRNEEFFRLIGKRYNW